MTRKTLNRRNILIGAAAATGIGAAALAGRSYVMRVSVLGDLLTPPEAYEYAASGEITLIDIRRPDEWVSTGVGKGAYPLDMRRQDFIAELDKIVGGARGTPVALICARGVRSRRMTEVLTDAGFTRIIDIPEGMLGSRVGPGWLGRGLPTVAYSGG